MLSNHHVSMIKESAPVLAEKGEFITTRFYEQMFEAHPELLNIFNHRNQKQGTQPKALRNTLYAAALNIEQLETLVPVVKQIAHKHRALQVLPEHYPIVGHYLLKAMKEELGEDASDEWLEAWQEAYQVVADIFIDAEKALYKEVKQQPGGWSGFRTFVIDQKQKESNEVTSFYLTPEDGGEIPTFLPGQYLTFQVQLPGEEHTHMRHYSLSDSPEKTYYRISIKREDASNQEMPAGKVSNYLHDHIEEGDQLQVSAPAGVFTVDLTSDEPIALLGAGIGQTPLMSMAKAALSVNPERKVNFVYTVENEENHALLEDMNHLDREYENFNAYIRYTHTEGRIKQEFLSSVVDGNTQKFYLCGPVSFTTDMKNDLLEKGVAEENIEREQFKPSI
ncbi:nitric oxide dioxygenase [Geomicrobium halophilum]|uniref:Flavohemoprotein n=1 Tax=Geomicrobium halophilum TaxID=549000 RepID=A0A841PUN3_9BACL|nr:NO-inducible flavohemoprotein [Geomicrobium halophilum]MBB6450846.1 nitric oxide dioxygenase [Geomicrobium halophilum]